MTICVTCGGKAFYLVSLLFFIQPCIDLCLDFFLCVGVKAADTGEMCIRDSIVIILQITDYFFISCLRFNNRYDIMIRRVELQDAKAITTIYNEYVRHSVATFETEPLREEDMRNRCLLYTSRCV